MKTTGFPLPDMALVGQHLNDTRIDDLPAALQPALNALKLDEQVTKGDTVAVALGSRGIDRIDEVARYCIRYLTALGLKPVIVPAMGSHGGATAAGQTECLQHLGITSAAVGAAIDARFDTTVIDSLDSGLPVHMAAAVLDADHLVMINRIKPHTKFRAAVESGLCKMLTIGLGKENGARAFHRHAVTSGFGIIESAAARVLEKVNLLCGVALVENGYGQLGRIECLPAARLIEREKALLQVAYKWMATIPFDAVDVLIVDFFGKDISGIGMDSNVTGRHRDITGDFLMSPAVKRIFVRDLSPGSDGNANGIGLADFTTRRLVDAIDMEKTVTNALAAISPEKAAIPVHFMNDRAALAACAHSIGQETLDAARVVRIKHTSSLATIQVSRALAPDVEARDTLKQLTPFQPLPFDGDGNLPPFPVE